MNRILIVGNGFDISHGLATRYSDFMLHYLKSILYKSHENKDGYKDDRISVERLSFWSNKDDFLEYLDELKTLNDFFSDSKIHHNINLSESEKSKRNPPKFKIEVNGKFLQKILSKNSLEISFSKYCL